MPEAIAARVANGPESRRGLLKRALVWTLAVLVVASIAWAGVRIARGRRGAGPEYQTAAVDRGAIAARVTANGTLSALVTVSVGSQVSGRIQSLGVDFGSPVKRGQVVATIDASLFRAAAAQARAAHRSALASIERADAVKLNAERQWTRAKLLFAADVMTKAERDTTESNLGVARADVSVARAQLAQARAALEHAELNLANTTIVSPIDGVVISRNVDVGQTVAATLQAPTLFTIAQDLTRMQVDTNIAEADVGRVREGMEVTFTVDAHPGKVFSGKVRQVRDNAQTIQNVVTYDAVIDVDNQDRSLKPGMTAAVTFVHSRKSDVLRAPNAALRFRPDAPTLAAMQAIPPPATAAADQRVVWVLRAGRATPIVVRIGISDGTFTEVVSGELALADLLVLEASLPAK